MLLHLYGVHAWAEESKADAETPRLNVNGTANGHVRADRQVRDAEEFELAGLMSDDEEPDTPTLTKERENLAAQL
jgi:hypothetical protein